MRAAVGMVVAGVILATVCTAVLWGPAAAGLVAGVMLAAAGLTAIDTDD